MVAVVGVVELQQEKLRISEEVFAVDLLLGLGQKTLLLRLSALRTVLVQQLEHL